MQGRVLQIDGGCCAQQLYALAARLFELLESDGEGQASDLQLQLLLLLRPAATGRRAFGGGG